MNHQRHSRQREAPPSPATSGWRPAWASLVVAITIAAGGLTYFLVSFLEAEAAPPTAPAAPARVPGDEFAAWTQAAPSPQPQAPLPPAQPASGGDETRDLSFYLARGENPTMTEVLARLHQHGVHTGIGAFSPPGTSPPLIGIAVPDDFALPKGYVRHHQSTDDGQRLEPILMYAPDYQPVNEANEPIALPKDRVVPPELAPPGLAVRQIVLPAPADQPSPRP